MKILMCHNKYQQVGGEDFCFAAESALLESHGHEVVRHVVHNDALHDMGRLHAAARTFWSTQSYREIRALIRRERPDLMHCTNTFPLLSPSVYYAARAEGVPVVQSLHNYRLLCPGALLLRDGAACETCVGRRFAWPGIRHACYRGSRAATAVVAGMTAAHRLIGTWRTAVDLYITPTEFAKSRFVAAGFPERQIAVKPNFLDPDPGVGDGSGGYALFVGRLSEEKGIATLLEAWKRLGRAIPLKIIGDGPLRDSVAAAANQLPGVEWLGSRAHQEVMQLLGDARCLVMPSICYETFGRTIVEAFARGTPVIASRMGCMEELVADGLNGCLFTPGDAADLARTIDRALGDLAFGADMRAAARRTYASRYTGESNYRQLLELYESVLAPCREPRTADERRMGQCTVRAAANAEEIPSFSTVSK